MYFLVCSSDSPSGGGRTVPRTMSRTSLWEALTKTRTVTRIALWEALSKSPSGKKIEPTTSLRGCTHTVSAISRASPSRTSSCRNPDSLSALRNYFAGREREARQVYGMCMRARMSFGAASPPLFIGKPRGKMVTKSTKTPPLYVTHKRLKKGKGVPCGAPWRSSTLGRPPLGGPPMRGFLGPQALLEAFWNYPKSDFP